MLATPYLDEYLKGRTFQLYSIVTKDALSEPASFSTTFDELERFELSGHSTNGVDIREVVVLDTA